MVCFGLHISGLVWFKYTCLFGLHIYMVCFGLHIYLVLFGLRIPVWFGLTVFVDV